MAAKKTTKTVPRRKSPTRSAARSSGRAGNALPATRKTATRKTVARKTTAVRKTAAGRAAGAKTARWSKQVMQHSDAMDLESGVFKLRSARAIATSLKKSSETSERRKASPFQSAMSMLNFEINRAGKNLSAERVKVLNQAKTELRKAFGRMP